MSIKDIIDRYKARLVKAVDNTSFFTHVFTTVYKDNVVEFNLYNQRTDDQAYFCLTVKDAKKLRDDLNRKLKDK